MDDIDDLALPGYATRALTPADAHGVYELMAAVHVASTGRVQVEEVEIASDWQRPSFDLATQSIGVLDEQRLVGYAEVSGGRRADAAVHPDYEGRGIGTALARWTQRISVRDGAGLVGMPVPDGSAGESLLRRLGYQVLWTSWALELPETRTLDRPTLPVGYVLRDACGQDDLRAVHDVLEDAFLEWSERERAGFADFLAETVQRTGYQTWNVRLVASKDREVIGAVVLVHTDDVGQVSRIAVRRDQRGRGLGRALLADAFALLRAHGTPRPELGTDTRTGALGLYQSVGMVVTSTWRHWAFQS